MEAGKPIRLKGHKLEIVWSGERKREERSSTGYCTCGWSESGSTGNVVRFEYQQHLKQIIEREEKSSAEKTTQNEAAARDRGNTGEAR